MKPRLRIESLKGTVSPAKIWSGSEAFASTERDAALAPAHETRSPAARAL